ncbi:WD-40 repeat protein, partial [Reticulomyxa filosa]
VKYFKPLRKLSVHSKINCVKFSPDGHKIVSALDDGTVQIWQIAENMEDQSTCKQLEGHTNKVKGAQFSPDGNMIVSCSADNTIRLWDVQSGKEIKTLTGHSSKVRASQFSADGKNILSISKDNTIRIWDVKSGQMLSKIERNTNIHDIHFSSNGQICFSTISSNPPSTVFIISDARSGEKIKEFVGHSSRVVYAQFSPDLQSIVSCANESSFRIWDVGSNVAEDIAQGDNCRVNYVLFSPDGKTIVSCSGSAIYLWDVRVKMETQILKKHTRDITLLDISPDGNTIVSASKDKTIRIWERL